MDQNKTENTTNESDELESLEASPDSSAENANTPQEGVTDTTQPSSSDEKVDPNTTITTTEKIEKKKRKNRGIEFLAGLNIYLLGFILVLVLAGIAAFLSYQYNKKEEGKEETLVTEPLSEEVLEQLRQTDVRVGDPKQILSIESNAVFAGKVLIRDSLEVAGQIKVGGPLELPAISVSGTGTFDQIQANDLQIAGNSKIQGQLAVSGSLTVGSNLSVAGSLTAGRLTIQNLEVSGDLKLSRHIDAGGGTPSRSNGNALGSGGTTSMSGTDTAGTVNVNIGGGPHAGCFATITFTQPFNSTPHVVITPVGGAAASVKYYVNRSSSGFSICTASTPPSGQSFAFDYIVIN